MVHLELALRDPLYLVSIVLLVAVIPAVNWAFGRGRRPLLRWLTVVVALVVVPACGFYALIGTSCYGFGGCP